MSPENSVQPQAKGVIHRSRGFRNSYAFQFPIGTDQWGNPIFVCFKSNKSRTEARNLAIRHLVTLAERNLIGQWNHFESKGADEHDKL